MQTNLPVLNASVLPAHLAAVVGKPSPIMAAAMTGMSSGSSALRLVANQGRFRIKEGSTETVLPDLFLDTIVVGALPGVTKSFYLTAYKPGDEKDNKQPDCSSLLGDVPDANAPNKQSMNCASCPQNAWGSKISPTGAEIKACSDYRRVALVAADDPETVYQANIPPASIKAWTKYLRELSLHGMDVSIVKTRISLDNHMWVFNFAGFVDAEQHAAVTQLVGSAPVNDVLGLTGRSTAPTAPALAAPAAPAPAPVVAPAPAPVAAPEPAPAAPAKGFGKKAAAAPAPAAAASVAPAAPISVAPANTGLDALANELGALISAPASV